VIHLGVDFGTTNSVVAVNDRTGCQVLGHRLEAPDGTSVVEPVFPSVVAMARGATTPTFGLAAEALSRRGSTRVLRSIKRQLYGYFDGKQVDLAGQALPLRETLTDLLAELRRSSLGSLEMADDEPVEVVATVPANANGAQRWITRRALQDAGFGPKLRLLDEPTAAALDFVGRALRRRRGQRRDASTILVYDLGGGTFDASLVRIGEDEVEVVSNGGIWQLGGDDFDAELELLVAESLALDLEALSPLQRRNLRAECRRAKETLSSYPQEPRRLPVSLTDLAISGRRGAEARIDLEAFYARLRPRIEASLEVVDEVLEGQGRPDRVYLVGGSTLLPLVGRMLTDRFPAVVRGNRPFESVAVGAALSHELAPSRLTRRLARHFGLLRLGGDDQGWEYMDVLFRRGTKLPPPGEVTVIERGPYRPFYDMGLLQYLECASLTRDGRPGRNRRDWQEIRFPYDPALGPAEPLDHREARRREDLSGEITEEYILDSDGVVSVRIRRTPDAYTELHEVCG
jgi:molecular chaperone DnaK (HSP70)